MSEVLLTVYDNKCYVESNDSSVHYFLYDALSREFPGKKYMKKNTSWDGIFRFYSYQYHSFKTGLLSYVCKLLRSAGHEFEIEDKRTKFFIPKEDIYQVKIKNKDKKVIKAVLRSYQQEAVERLLENNGGLVYIATNGGKSVIIASFVLSILNQYSFKALILVHRKELVKQLYELFSLNIMKDEIGLISADKIDVAGKSIVIGMVQTLSKRLKAKDITVTDFVKYINMLVIDETHHAKASTYKNVIKMAKKCLIKAGFSGTVPKPSTLDGLTIRELMGSVVSRITNKDLIDQKVSLIPKIFMIKTPCNVDLKQVEKNAKKDYYIERTEKGKEDKFAGMGGVVFQRIYEAGIVYNTFQNSIIIKVVKDTLSRGLQTLVIVNRRETHGVELSEIFTTNEIDHVLWTGQTKDRDAVLKKFKDGKTPVMIATSVVDEGLNIEGIDCIVLASGYKSHIQLLQRLGRGLRTGSKLDYLLVVDFYHNAHKILKDHSRKRLDTWEKEKLDVQVIKDFDSFKKSVDKLEKHNN